MSTTAAKGFVAGGIACGIKESGAPDLALVATDDHVPVAAAAVFTSNLAQAGRDVRAHRGVHAPRCEHNGADGIAQRSGLLR